VKHEVRGDDVEVGQVLDRFLDRLAVELANRVERRLEQIAAETARKRST
jgi:hypothetical protein